MTRRYVLLVSAVVLVGVALRGPLIAVAPVTGQLRGGLHVGSATAGLFTSVPVFLFAIAAPPALLLLRRAGLDAVIMFSLVGVALGAFVRSSGGLAVALTGTVLMGLAIGIANVAVPVAIGRDFAGRAGPITGVYTASLNVGAMLTSLLTAPLASVVGWRWALAGWGLLGLAGAGGWTTMRGRRRPSERPGSTAGEPAATAPATAPGAGAPAASAPAARVPAAIETSARATSATAIWMAAPATTAMWRRPAAVLLTAAFAGQAFSYYGVTAWLPSLLADERGLSRTGAGLSSSLFQILGVVGAVTVPVLVHRGVSRRAVFLAMSLCWVVLPTGLVVAPAWWPAWCALGGLAQGAGITIIFILVLHHARSVEDRQRLSTLVQGVGYAIGAAGPTVVGAVHQLTGTWRLPMLVVVVAVGVMTISGMIAVTIPAAHVQT